MQKIALLLLFLWLGNGLWAQKSTNKRDQALHNLIDQYAQARENRDTSLLKAILMPDVDQLVSTGEWRKGIRVAVKGMLRSTVRRSGQRTLSVESIKMLSNKSAQVDCRYEIKNADGTDRKMWSSFTAVKQKGKWRIAGIRNMLPAR